jgi:hypothetical protein
MSSLGIPAKNPTNNTNQANSRSVTVLPVSTYVKRCEAGKAEVLAFQAQHDAFDEPNPRLTSQFRPGSAMPQIIEGALGGASLTDEAKSLLDYDALLKDCVAAEQGTVSIETGLRPHQYTGLDDIVMDEVVAKIKDGQDAIIAKVEALNAKIQKDRRP